MKKKLNHLYGKIFDEIGSIIKMMQEQGRLEMNVNPQALAIMFQALIQGVHLSRIITPEDLQLDFLVSEISQVLWRALIRQTVNKMGIWIFSVENACFKLDSV